jgi:hypothetical protein
MAAARFNDPIEPMDLANMRQNGVRSLEITCHQCRHKTVMNVDHVPRRPHGEVVRAAHGVHEMRDHRRRRQTELARAGAALVRRRAASRCRPRGTDDAHDDVIRTEGRPSFADRIEHRPVAVGVGPPTLRVPKTRQASNYGKDRARGPDKPG